jgi:hypothetical protein
MSVADRLSDIVDGSIGDRLDEPVLVRTVTAFRCAQPRGQGLDDDFRPVAAPSRETSRAHQQQWGDRLACGVRAQEQRPEVFDVLGHDPSSACGSPPEELGIGERSQLGISDDGHDVVTIGVQPFGDLSGVVLVEQ